MTKEPKTVKKDGLSWRVIGRTARATTHKGKHYLAIRCREGRPWNVLHTQNDISVHGVTKDLACVARHVATGDLNAAVLNFS